MRRTPYTERGVHRVPCAKCNGRAELQWSTACATDNQFVALCVDCDVALNRMVLEWLGLPDVDGVMAAYESRMRVEVA